MDDVQREQIKEKFNDPEAPFECSWRPMPHPKV